MESLLSLLRMHWDHEPTPNPSQEGNRSGWPVLLPAGPAGAVVQFRSKLGSELYHFAKGLFRRPRRAGSWKTGVASAMPASQKRGFFGLLSRITGANYLHAPR